MEINTKTKAASQIKESVKVVGKVSVTKKPVISESTLRQIEAATDVAAALSFAPSFDMSPVQIIEAALSTIEELPRLELLKLEKLLMVAESLGVDFNRELTPSLLEAKKVEEDEEDEDEEKEDVKDTSDYKLSASGKKVRAHRIVFNKGEEEKHQSEEVESQSVNKINEFAKFVSKHGKKTQEEIDQMSEENLFEVLKKTDPTGKWISDFVHSKNPKFEGKSKKERMKMALGAYYAAQRKEEVEKPKKVNESSSAKDLVRRLLNK